MSSLPYSREGTSREAAEFAKPYAETQRDRVKMFLREKGEYGATDQEISRELAIRLNAVQPRRGELEEVGSVKDSGNRRKNDSGLDAIVWIYVGEGNKTQDEVPTDPAELRQMIGLLVETFPDEKLVSVYKHLRKRLLKMGRNPDADPEFAFGGPQESVPEPFGEDQVIDLLEEL